MRQEQPNKALRRVGVASGETDDSNRVAGATGRPGSKRRRPGRAASLRGIAATKRSERWRNPEKGAPNMRRGNLAKGSRTGRNKTA